MAWKDHIPRLSAKIITMVKSSLVLPSHRGNRPWSFSPYFHSLLHSLFLVAVKRIYKIVNQSIHKSFFFAVLRWLIHFSALAPTLSPLDYFPSQLWTILDIATYSVYVIPSWSAWIWMKEWVNERKIKQMNEWINELMSECIII